MSSDHATIMRSEITSNNQVILPKKVRKFLNVEAGDMIEWRINPDGSITILPIKPSLWEIVNEQEKKFGNLSTPEIDWGQDIFNN